MMNRCIILWTLMSSTLASQQEVITVDSTNGNDTLCTHNNSYPCKTLHTALKAVRNDIIVQIHNGTYPHNTTTTLTYSNVNITGSGSDVTIVECDSNGTGFGFINVTNIHISELTLLGCGALRNSTTLRADSNVTLPFRAALYYLNIRNVTIDDVVVSNSIGMGVAMYDVTGHVTVSNSIFRNNSVPSHESTLYPGGGGFSVEFSYCKAGSHLLPPCNNINKGASYLFYNCSFDFNIASTLNQTESSYPDRTFGISNQQFGRGGGLSVFFKGHSKQNIINISDCTFDSNHAVWGGGFHSDIVDYSTGNKLIIQKCNFTNNYCNYSDSLMTTGTGGGGARIAFLFYDLESQVTNNSVQFINCKFRYNIAYYGGGLSCRITKEGKVINASNSLELVDCTWVENRARTGSGVDIISHVFPHGLSPVVRLMNCNFTHNDNSYSSQSAFPSGIGALYADNIPVEFSGNCIFHQNLGSAVAGIATYFMFANNSCVEFSNNFGWHGAAIALLGNAYLVVYHNTSLTFIRNTAVTKGGAIYYVNSGQKDFANTQRCLFYYYDLDANFSDWNTTFNFSGNKAFYGNSIHCTTLLTCIWGNLPGKVTVSKEDILQVFNWSGIFYYDSGSNRSDEIATDTAEIMIGTSERVRIPPGQLYQLNMTSLDDRNRTAHPVFFAETNNSHISSVDNTTTYISDKFIKLHGKVHSNISLHLQSINSRSWSVTINVTIDDCPPGFYYPADENTPIREKVCKCSTGTSERLYGVTHCDNNQLMAHLNPQFWIGYVSINGERILMTSDCLQDYCSKTAVQLPNRTVESMLSDLTCTSHRTGHVCGKCQDGTFVFINSRNFKCGHCNDTWSRYGFLVIIVSKYVPLTVMMCFIMFFDISLVDGPLNSFILYSQILVTLQVFGNGKVGLPTKSSGLALALIDTAIHLYNVWNLQFFEFLLPHFCVFKHNSSMPSIIAQYTPALYVLLLCLLLFNIVPWILQICAQSQLPVIQNAILKMGRMCIRLRRRWSVKNSVIHSLTTFLVLSYARITLVTFRLLAPVNLYGPGGEDSYYQRRALWFDGTMSYFGQEHLPYAIVALLMLVTFVLIPPLLLLSYPLLPVLLTRLGLENYWIVKKLITNPLSKCVPIFDAFQSCYKDQYRFFAGLLFVYRVAALAIYDFSPSTAVNYVWIQLFFLSVLLLHCICQPYKNKWHNFIEAFILTVLACVSVISSHRLLQAEVSGSQTDFFFWVQATLLYCPLICFAGYVTYKVIQRLSPCVKYMCRGIIWNNADLLNSQVFPARLEDDGDNYSSTSEDTTVAPDDEELEEQDDDVEMIYPVHWTGEHDRNNSRSTHNFRCGRMWATQ